jgi:preprotein translocase subunit SecD
MRQPILLLALLLQGASARPVTLAVELVTACSASANVKVKTAAGTQCLDARPFLTERDVESAELQKNAAGHPVIFLTFRNEAAMRELQITRHNIGKPVAILLNGRVVAAPTIAAASRLLYIELDVKPDQAAAMVAALNQQAQRNEKSGVGK